MSAYNSKVSDDQTDPVLFADPPQTKANNLNELHNWFHSLPEFSQAFVPLPNLVSKEKLPSSVNENCGRVEMQNVAPIHGVGETTNLTSGSASRRFLVFDQSGDRTTLVFSSGITRPPVECLALHPKLPASYYLSKGDLGTNRDTTCPSHAFLTVGDNEDARGNDVESDLHEDTEELNALLYSDDEKDDSEVDEVTSTGNSPSALTAYDKQEWSDESGEEVASCGGPIKRQKLYDGRFDVPVSAETTSSMKINRCFEDDNDAESSCGNGNNNQMSGESASSRGVKRLRKERIRETVNVLKSIIPGGNGKDAMVVLDKAIHYLRSLKFKAKALGPEVL